MKKPFIKLNTPKSILAFAITLFLAALSLCAVIFNNTGEALAVFAQDGNKETAKGLFDLISGMAD